MSREDESAQDSSVNRPEGVNIPPGDIARALAESEDVQRYIGNQVAQLGQSLKFKLEADYRSRSLAECREEFRQLNASIKLREDALRHDKRRLAELRQKISDLKSLLPPEVRKP